GPATNYCLQDAKRRCRAECDSSHDRGCRGRFLHLALRELARLTCHLLACVRDILRGSAQWSSFSRISVCRSHGCLLLACMNPDSTSMTCAQRGDTVASLVVLLRRSDSERPYLRAYCRLLRGRRRTSHLASPLLLEHAIGDVGSC